MVRASRAQARAVVPTITRMHELDLDGLGHPSMADESETPVVIHNVVATASFGVTIDLEKLAWSCYGECTNQQSASRALKSTSLGNLHHAYCPHPIIGR